MKHSDNVVELRKDKERLDWCIKHVAIPMKSKDGVWGISIDGEFMETLSYTARAAIDAAMSSERKTKA